MLSRIAYFFFLLAFVILCAAEESCHTTRKEYIERNGLHSDDKPSVIAKDLGNQGKAQQRAYMKQLRRAKKDIAKRNKEAQKNITKAKIKTTKATRKPDKGTTPKEVMK
jgi:hypothetical protein